jgi:SET domain
MLLIVDGMDLSAWELDANWEAVDMDPLLWDDDVEEEEHEHIPQDEDENLVPFAGFDEVPDQVQNDGTVTVSPICTRNRDEVHIIPITAQNTLREILIAHFSTSYRLGRVQWPRNMSQDSRARLGKPQPITETGAMLRALSYCNAHLVVQHSRLRKIGNGPNLFHDCIGNGLFTGDLPILKGETVAEFIGEFITAEEGKRRDEAGFGGYMVMIRRNSLLLDCYRFRDQCKASMVNSPRGCIDLDTNLPAVSNVKLSYDHRRRKYRLVAIRDISPNTEILWDYGSDYRYPAVQTDS